MRGRSRKGQNPLTRSYESNGPDVKIRGTALHIAEKYMTLGRDAQTSGDRVAAENYFQHAEHYYRIIAAAQAQMPQPQQVWRGDEDGDDDAEERASGNGAGGPQRHEPPTFVPGDPQPFVNGGGRGDGDDRQRAASEEGADGERPHRGRRRRPYRRPEAGSEDGGETPVSTPESASSED